MAERFTDAQRIGSLQKKLMAMADNFETMLDHLIRQDLDGVEDSLVLEGCDGWGVQLEIRAKRLRPDEVAAVRARQGQKPHA